MSATSSPRTNCTFDYNVCNFIIEDRAAFIGNGYDKAQLVDLGSGPKVWRVYSRRNMIVN